MGTGGIKMRFNHITLIVSERERSKAFYTALGLAQLVDTPPRYARFTFPDGDATLSLEVTGDTPHQPSVHIFFECDDLDKKVAALKARGIAFYHEPTDMFYQWREARLWDPDGHDVRLYRDNLANCRLDPPWKIAQPASA
jgi:catechol 2,3-dioxygenase-like lactoylglutathione lyase family enzyme